MSDHNNREKPRVVNYDALCGAAARKLTPGESLPQAWETVAELDDLQYVDLARRYLRAQETGEEINSDPNRGSDPYLWMLVRWWQGKKLAGALGFDYKDQMVRNQILPAKARALVQALPQTAPASTQRLRLIK